MSFSPGDLVVITAPKSTYCGQVAKVVRVNQNAVTVTPNDWGSLLTYEVDEIMRLRLKLGNLTL